MTEFNDAYEAYVRKKAMGLAPIAQIAHPPSTYTQSDLDAAVAAERERCIRICESTIAEEDSEYGRGNDAACWVIADAIRNQER